MAATLRQFPTHGDDPLYVPLILAADALDRAELTEASIRQGDAALLRPSAVAITMPRISPIAQPGGPDVAT